MIHSLRKKLVDVEDLYRPYKEKKKTKASEAIKAGLEPLAKKCLEFTDFDLFMDQNGYYSYSQVDANRFYVRKGLLK